MRRTYRGDAFNGTYQRMVDDNHALAKARHAASLKEPTKREPREIIAQAVRNTAAMRGRGK